MEPTLAAACAAMAFVPNVWGEGLLMAFSGLEGPTSWERQLIASAGPAPGHLRIRFPREDDLHLAWTYNDLAHDTRDPASLPECEVVVASGDVVDMIFTHTDGARLRLSLAFTDKDTLLGRLALTQAHAPVALTLALDQQADQDHRDDRGGAWLARSWGEALLANDLPIHFAVTLAPAAPALDEASFLAAWNARLAFFADLPQPTTDDELLRRTFYKAWSVVKVNQESAQGAIPYHWTTPDRWPHRHMWLWDTTFHGFVLARIAPRQAEESLLAVLSQQHEDGMISHWGRPDGNRSKMTQPPILGWGIWDVYQQTENVDFLRRAYPPLRDFLRWVTRTMDTNENGLCEWARGGHESGMDNSVRFDAPGLFDSVDLNAFLAHDYQCLARIAEVVAPDEAAQWEAEAEAINQRINDLLWHEADGLYYDRNVDGSWRPVPSCASFLPLLSGAPSPEQSARLAQAVREQAVWGRLPVASIALTHPDYERDMWRGPTWLNVTHAIAVGLRRQGQEDAADLLQRRMVEEVARWYAKEGVIYEYYDAQAEVSPTQLYRKGKRGGGHWINQVIPDYHWSAVVYILALSQDR